MPIDYKDSLNKLNQLLAESQGKPVSIESIVETLVTEDVDAVSYTHLRAHET